MHDPNERASMWQDLSSYVSNFFALQKGPRDKLGSSNIIEPDEKTYESYGPLRPGCAPIIMHYCHTGALSASAAALRLFKLFSDFCFLYHSDIRV